MRYFATLSEWDSDFLSDVHPANRVAYQASRGYRCSLSASVACLWGCSAYEIVHRPSDCAAQKRNTPGDNQYPETNRAIREKEFIGSLPARASRSSQVELSPPATSPLPAGSPLHHAGQQLGEFMQREKPESNEIVCFQEVA